MGLIKTAAKVAVASSVHGRVQRRQQQRWAAQDQQAAAAQDHPEQPHPAPPPPYSPPGAPPTERSLSQPASAPLSTAEKITQLKSLGELRDSGVLTEAEFEAEKRTLLQG